MKITLTILGMLFCIAWLPGQQSSQSALSQTINAKRLEGKAFKARNLFQPISDGGRSNVTAEVPAEIRSYELLQLEEENLQELIGQSPETFTLTLPSKGRSPLEIELVQVQIFSEGFRVRTDLSHGPVEVETGLFYRGIVKGDDQSIAAVSIFENEVRGLISSPSLGNLNLGKVSSKGRSNDAHNYILYDDRPLVANQNFDCGTADDGPEYTMDELSYTSSGRGADDCVRIYFEVDNDIFRDKGSVAKVTEYVTGLFNEVALLYANDNVNVIISEIFIWESSSPYTGTSSGSMLSQFQNYRTSFNGELGQLLSYKASGGIAVLSGLCHPYSWARLSFASIKSSYSKVPNYSFSVMVVAHELGHLLGSQHTHACVWNGNNTAIDGCAGFTEGSCANPGKPSDGGTIMSYCHITSAGINFSKGFGPQPGSVIRSRVSAGNCMQVCSSPPSGGGGGGSGGDSGGGSGGDSGGGDDTGCAGSEVTLTLTLDNFGPETTWEITDKDGNVMAEGGPYDKKQAGIIMNKTFCLPDGCYDFNIMDEDGDGICCDYGQGSFILKDDKDQVMLSGGDFEYETGINFCLPYEPGGGDGNCLPIDLSKANIVSYGGSQDAGTYEIVNNGTVLKLENNAWKAILMDYNITSNTVLEFEFFSTTEGEIHGIGLDDNNSISYSLTFKLYGTQAWGLLDYDDYPGGGVWKKYSIPVGKFYSGQADRLFFTCDNDRYPHQNNAYYRNIKLLEGTGCGSQLPTTTPTTGLDRDASTSASTDFGVYPNPASDQLHLTIPDAAFEQGGMIQVFSTTGQAILQKELSELNASRSIPVASLPQGTYLIRYDDGQQTHSRRFTILRE